MNVPIESLSPQLWAANSANGGVELHILCAKRLGRVLAPLGASSKIAAVVAPISIQISPADGFSFPSGWLACPFPIRFPISGISVVTKTRFYGDWYASMLEGKEAGKPRELLIGISNKSARIALKEAYRAVRSAVIDLSSMRLKTEFNTKLLREYDGGTPLRNLMTCMLWDLAAEQGDPAEILADIEGPLGAKWEGRALSEFATKVGLR